MFQALHALLHAGASLSLNLSSNTDGTLTVIVAPKGEGALAQPLALTATPEELDAQFADVVATYAGARKSLAEQVEATAAVLEAAQKESASKATKALTKSAAASTVKEKPVAASEDDDDDAETGTPPQPAATAPASAPGSATSPDVGNLFDTV